MKIKNLVQNLKIFKIQIIQKLVLDKFFNLFF
jgi:hypothetical protein